MRFALCFAVLCVVGCQFERPTDVDFPIDAGIDSPDAAPPECVAGSRTCDADKYTECDATGHFVTYEVPNAGPDGSPTTLTMHDYACPLGCHTTEPRCLDVLPTNGVVRAIDGDYRQGVAGAVNLATAVFGMEDSQEALAAFVAKRKPVWKKA